MMVCVYLAGEIWDTLKMEDVYAKKDIMIHLKIKNVYVKI